ncbi:hypothetical protein [Pseudovibrio sp. SPO723]|uniref:hypothetical protein n=1 Tax=Nesiotobacter zosterae TaxID=392721 RepID=UPI0029C54691|nr:hypothetical protein [Pseudovibrio sp. SPO723]MDX5595467.1 hypothetical protein [Pseudovibrio sp. SPO723]
MGTAEKLLAIDPKKLAEYGPGRIWTLFTAINKSNDVLVGQSTLALFDAPFAIAFLVLVWFLGGPTVVGPLVVLAIFGALVLLSARTQAKAGLHLFDASAEQTSLLMTHRDQLDQLIQHGTIGNFLGDVRACEKRRAAAQEVAERNLSAALNLTQTGGLATTIAVLGIGSLVVLKGDMTTGGLAACLILGQRGVAGILGLVNALARRQVSASAYRNIRDLLSTPPTSTVQAPLAQSDQMIGLRFGVKDQQLEAQPGQCLFVNAQSGQHEAALFRELAQALECGETGENEWLQGLELFTEAGAPVSFKDCHIAVCSANPTVFNGTLLENMTAFDVDARERAIALSEELGLSEAIGRLKDGVQTSLAPGLGIPLSHGHLKRLALVRALSGAPQLLILHKPFLYLDADGTAQLTKLLKSLDGKTTVIVFDNTADAGTRGGTLVELHDQQPYTTEVAA